MSALPGVEATPEVCRALRDQVLATTPAGRRPRGPTRGELAGTGLALVVLYLLTWMASVGAQP